jgi:hypothetical protein
MQLTQYPSIVITGWAFGGHAQALMFSTMVHSIFGYTLAVAGIARIIEVCFVAYKDTTPSLWGDDADDAVPRGTPTSGGISPLRAFRYLPPFVSWLDPHSHQLEEMHDLMRVL